MSCDLYKYKRMLDRIHAPYKEGDIFHFDMPGFCSGDYDFTVKNNFLVDAPSKIFDGCRNFTIIRNGKMIFSTYNL